MARTKTSTQKHTEHQDTAGIQKNYFFGVVRVYFLFMISLMISV